MITILLTILKVIGIFLLILLSAVILLALLALFVPVRYRIGVRRKEGDGIPMVIDLKVTWLLHLVNIAFSYPEAAFLRVRLFCFTLFQSDKKKEKDSDDGKKKKQSVKAKKKAPADNSSTEKKTKISPSQNESAEKLEGRAESAGTDILQNNSQKEKQTQEEGTNFESETDGEQKRGFRSKIKEFFQKLLSLFQNIRYTITQICDKIKHIVNNIQYYLDILKSDTFKGAWPVCSGQVISLLKSILPDKFTGSLLIGTGDPASTGQILAICSMLYPLLGNHITITPDFERQIVEGELFLKGKITLFKGLKTAWKIYFNRDVRRLIKLFKREAA